MKSISVLLYALALAVAGQAQPYHEGKQMSPQERAFYLEYGFPVQDYQFDQLQINENLALAWKRHRGAKADRVVGGSTLALGVGLLFTGAVIGGNSPSGSDDPLTAGISALGNAVGTAMIVSGLAGTTVGIVCIASGNKKAKKRDQAMESARRLHLEMISPP